MRNRTLFRLDMIPEFTEFMEKLGYASVEPMNEYEALRFLKNDVSFEVVSFHRRKHAETLTIHGRGAELFLQWVHENPQINLRGYSFGRKRSA